jgi:hypothetical protein
MKMRLAALAFCLALAAAPALAQTAPATVTTTKKSALAVGSGSFALIKGTKLEVVAREGDTLIVKLRSAQGKIPLADTDYPADAVAALPAEPVAPAVQTAAATPAPKAAPAKTATPPALNTSGQGQQPITNYGKAVQKAKQAAESNKSTHVDPTKGIMDDEPKK